MTNRHHFTNSTSIGHCDYEDATGTLKIKFLSSEKEHSYPDVPKQIYEGLKKAGSPGGYFHQNIRKQFKANEK